MLAADSGLRMGLCTAARILGAGYSWLRAAKKGNRESVFRALDLSDESLGFKTDSGREAVRRRPRRPEAGQDPCSRAIRLPTPR